MKKFSCILFAAISFFTTTAQLPGIRFEKFTTQNGLTNNFTGNLLQDSHGFLWIATSWGLNRYDGRVMKQYNKTGPAFLPDLNIRSLAEDKKGNIWIATSKGLCSLDPLTEKFTQYHLSSTATENVSGSCEVYIDKYDDVWVAGINSLSLLNKKDQRFSTTAVTTIGHDIRRNRYISHFFEDSKGRFWIATSFGIKLFDREKKTYHSYHFEEKDGKSRLENAVQGIFEDKDGNIWSGTWNAGLLKFNETKNVFEHYTLYATDARMLNSVHDVNAITLNGTYYLLLATDGGLVIVDPLKINNGMLPVEKLIPEDNSAEPKEKERIYRDRQNNYWISGSGGLIKIDMDAQVYQWKNLPDEAGNANVFHAIPSISGTGNDIFFTTEKNWWKYDYSKKIFSKHILPAGSEDILTKINRFITEPDGYWFTSNVGVGFYNIKTNSFKNITSLVKASFYSNVRAGLIFKDDSGKIWFTVYRSGIRIYNPATGSIASFLADSAKKGSLYGMGTYDVQKMADGSFFIATGVNVYHIFPADLSYEILPVPAQQQDFIERMGPRNILLTQSGRLFFLSMQCIYEYRNNQLLKIFPADGSADFIMDNFLQDKKGDIWVSTNLGLYKTDTAFKEWSAMTGKTDGINSDNVSELACYDGNEFIVSAMGRVGFFSTNGFIKNETGPVVMINRLKTGDASSYFVSLQNKKYEFSFKEAIELEISAINFINENGNRIYYKLEGWDKEWKELEGNPVVRYEQLPSGNYVFNAKAVNEDGVWSKEDAKLVFTVTPPFWKTWWFIALMILISTFTLFMIYRYRLKKALEMERLRTRIATDLHDDIGATLSSISMYSQSIKQQLKEKNPQLENVLDKMGENSRDMVTSISDIVWAINPDNDDGKKLLQRMENYAADICAVKNVTLHFEADEKIGSMLLPLEHRKNIYLIFKEAVNNAVKYAEAKNIIVKIKLQNKELTLMIRDDGKGFNETTVNKGNGLKNLQTRSNEIKGNTTIDSEEGKGTTVYLQCSI
ncbi:MAG: two-component regulator propeller domain-containing protein [Ferruginibacter sp.]